MRCNHSCDHVHGGAEIPRTRARRGAVAWVGAGVLALALVVPVAPATAQPPAAAPRIEVDSAAPKLPTVHAAAWLVGDLDSGAVLAAADPTRRLAPASTLKILTALTAAPRLDPQAVYTARRADAAIEGSKVGLVPGSRYRVSDLLHGLLLSSGNDAANALATMLGGRGRAAELMNARARELGALDTVAVNPSGLDARGQVSTPHDLAVLARALLDDRQLARIVVTKRYRFPARGVRLDGRRKRFEIQNHNRLLGAYRGATGVKNGYTSKARASLVASARRGEHQYVVVMMRSRSSTYPDATALLNWAFRAGPRAAPVGRLGALTPPAASAAGGPAVPTLRARSPRATDAAQAGAGLEVQAASAAPGSPAGAMLPTSAAVAALGVALAGLLLFSRRRRRAGSSARAPRRARPGPR